MTLILDSQPIITPKFSQNCARNVPKKLFGKLVYKVGPVIPGLASGVVPQGLAYSVNQGLFLLTAYLENGTPSQLFLVDEQSGILKKSFSLCNKAGSPHFGHVGGVATDGNLVWVVSDGFMYSYQPFEHFDKQSTSANFLNAIEEVQTEAQADYVTFYDGVIYVGEFYLADRSQK